ncbi:hypothetical protein CH254_18045 [Rhodococcus sp. 06-412-2C]|uniref:hypothetical protein n=1 Tax=unclassified Rhodococcus (in: high G+C Gram-positive bacteria) TaxID=192944 RepID=UPI000B9BE2EE|nr:MULTISPECIES: hypothetical protein [unclassified Rhodococcus (in: high G+C Gram-positive bacteria)]OZC86444.1 hypothetical protein CH254_18045 [Rhodococcus sp. 06-412-2C]OZD02144.1 hypothetical protein CH279_04230 [Rhodococcus sp. 06-412-2B]
MTTLKITITDGTRPLAVFVRTELASEQDPDEYDMHAYPNHLPRWGIKGQRDRAVRAHERSEAVLPSPNRIAMAINKVGPVREVWLDRDGKPIAFEDTGSYADVERIKYVFPRSIMFSGEKLDVVFDKLATAGIRHIELDVLQDAVRYIS